MNMDKFVAGAKLQVLSVHDKDEHEVINSVVRESRVLIEALQWQFARRGMKHITLSFDDLQNLHDIHIVDAKRFNRL